MKRKILFSILFLFTFCKLSFAGSISVSSFVTADDVTVTHLEQMRTTFQGAINSSDGGLLQTGTVSSSKLDANTNPENRWNEAFNDFIYSGCLPPTSATLSSTTSSGVAYVQGVRVVKDATAHTYTASKHTYVDLSNNGTYTYCEVAINAAEPEVTANSIRLARVSTDATTVAQVRDDRVTTISLGVGSATFLADADSDTMIQLEESSDEDIIRFDTGGTERAILDSTGLTLKASVPLILSGSSSGTITLTTPTAAGTNTITLPAETGTAVTTASTIYYVGSFTRDVSLITDLAITGVGFTPRVVVFFSSLANFNLNIGLDNGTFNEGVEAYGATPTYGTGNSLEFYDGTNEMSMNIKTLDLDGFTLECSKVNSPTGTANIKFIAFK